MHVPLTCAQQEQSHHKSYLFRVILEQPLQRPLFVATLTASVFVAAFDRQEECLQAAETLPPLSSFIYLFIYFYLLLIFIHSFMHSFIHLHIQSLTYSFIYSSI